MADERMETDHASVDMASLTLEDDEEGVVIVDDEVGQEYGDSDLCVVGRFLNARPVNFTAMKHTLAALMQPAMGMSVREINGGLYVFQFFHKVDMNRILDMSPWTFNNNPLIMEKLGDFENPWDVPLNHMYMWVKVFGLKSGFRSESVMKTLGDALGEFIEADPENFTMKWREYWRIRVRLDLSKPIKESMTLKKEKTKEAMGISFTYERIPTFCFLCGIIGHGERFCPLLVSVNGALIPRKFGPHLRDSYRRTNSLIGSKWLRDEPGMEEAVTGGKECGFGGGGDGKGKADSKGVNHLAKGKNPNSSGGMKGGDEGVLKEVNPSLVNADKSMIEEEILDDSIQINDPKRRRTGLGEPLEGEEIGPSGGDVEPIEDDNLFNDNSSFTSNHSSKGPNASKNGGKAGSGFQTRRKK